MFQFAPRKMVETQPSNSLPDEGAYGETGMMYGNSDTVSPSSTSSNPQSPWRQRVSESDSFDDPDSPPIKSPPIMRTQSYDAALFDLRKVSPDKIAAQLTLIDLELFKAIRMTELVDAKWIKKEKATLAPNVVAFTKRFNHTSFWVVREILNEPLAKARGDLITQFIKISKKLFELNNLHSLRAVVGGLQSGPIYRLSQSWKHVTKKDRGTLERLDELLSADENWKALRAHMDAAKLPCIPHLGLYLTDLCFLGSSSSNEHKEDSIRNMIAYFQNSTYDSLVPELHVQKYLLHKRYIDELQKFYEDDNFRLSQEREPDQVRFHKNRSESSAIPSSILPTPIRVSRSYHNLLSPTSESPPTSTNKSNTFTKQTSKHNTSMLTKQMSKDDTAASTHAGVRVTVDQHSPHQNKKTSTLPNSFRGAPPNFLEFKSNRTLSGRGGSGPASSSHLLSPVDIPEGRGVVTVSPGFKRKFTRGHKKASSLGSNVLQMLGVGKHSNSSPGNSREGSPRMSPTHSVSLIDDTPLTSSAYDTTSPVGSMGTVSVSSDSSDESGDEDEALYKKLENVDEVEVDYLQARLIMEGPLQRKMAKKGGRGVSFTKTWSKVWAQLTDSALIFLPSKPKKKNTKPVRTKGMVLRGWGVKHKDEKNNEKTFLVFSDSGTQIKFKASSSLIAHTWVDYIEKVIKGEQERERRKAEECLITL